MAGPGGQHSCSSALCSWPLALWFFQNGFGSCTQKLIGALVALLEWQWPLHLACFSPPSPLLFSLLLFSFSLFLLSFPFFLFAARNIKNLPSRVKFSCCGPLQS
jgi:hypothetical protein